MPEKEILFEDRARKKLSKGLDQLADVVAVTLGPKGRNVGLDFSFGSPHITNDGASIIKEMELKDRFENLGMSLGKEVANKIKENSGDGTTTGIILLRALVKEGMKNISSGANSIALKRGMDKALKKVLEKIDDITITVKNEKQILDIAIVSASGNIEIGQNIAEAFKKVGKTGIITVEEGTNTETSIDLEEGMQFDRGYLSSYFCTNTENMSVEMHNPKILLTDKKISTIQEILPLIQSIASTSQELLIIAEDVEGEALSTLVMNKLKGILKVCAIKAPSFGEQRKALLEDLSILIKTPIIMEEKDLHLKDVTMDLLGSCEKVFITKETTTIIEKKGNRAAIEQRVLQIENEIKNTESAFEKEKLKQRKAKLEGGVAVIRVGAFTDSGLKQKKQIYQDSLHSTRAALESGLIAGGGIGYIFAKEILENIPLNLEEKIGANILKQALSAPFFQIVSNAGKEPATILGTVLQKGYPFGYNVESQQVENLIQSGVIDPAKIVKNALIYAVSSAGMMLLSEALIADAQE